MSAELTVHPTSVRAASPARASDLAGAFVVGRWLAIGAVGLALFEPRLSWSYLASLPFLALFLVQAFILLHECGHFSLFRTRALNRVLGHAVGWLSFIPFGCWRRIHRLHHVWTGYRDRDPTTENTYADRFPGGRSAIVDFAWKWSLPLFTLGYRFGTYWNRDKLRRHLEPAEYEACVRSLWIHGTTIVTALVLVALAAPAVALALVPAYWLSFMICDLLTLSQHSHIEMKHSRGAKVPPMPVFEQVVYTRSLAFPEPWGEWLLLGFHRHEIHHAYPTTPCYRLGDEAYAGVPRRNTPVRKFLASAKRLSGTDFVFRTKKDCEF